MADQNTSKGKLLSEIERLKTELRKKKKYGLVWEDKPEEVVLMCKEKLPVLKEVKSKEIMTDKTKPVNLLIEGDNYHALSVLNYTHKGKIDVIYIDPPYNTGARDWKYNNDYVDSGDPYRHSMWLSFMKSRLSLSKSLLKNDGIICVTIDDYEMPRLWMLMDEIFGENNHLGTVVIRNNPKGRMTNRKVSLVHEYALFFGRSNNSFISLLPVKPEDKTHTYIEDKDGSWYVPVNLRKQGIDSTAMTKSGKLSGRYYPIYLDPETGKLSSMHKYRIEILPIDVKGEKRIWRRAQDVIDEMFKSGNLWAKKQKSGYQLYYKFRGGLKGDRPQSIWYDAKFSASEYGTQTLDRILGSRELFQFPKSPHAVTKSILTGTDNMNAVILDFFAGSGTTGQAVLELNKMDNGNRKFVLCTNNENNIATEVCYPRIKKVIQGYKSTKSGKVEGLGGNLKYFKTDFVGATGNDKNRTKLTREAVEMLCIKEGTFEAVVDELDLKIFKNHNHYCAIIFDETMIPKFKKELKKLDGQCNVYIFSLGDDTFDEEFEDVKSKVKLSPIPEAILRVYRRIFK